MWVAGRARLDIFAPSYLSIWVVIGLTISKNTGWIASAGAGDQITGGSKCYPTFGCYIGNFLTGHPNETRIARIDLIDYHLVDDRRVCRG